MNRLWLAVAFNVAVTAYMLYGWLSVHRMHPGANMALGFTWLFALQVHVVGTLLLLPLKKKSRSSLGAWGVSVLLFAAATLWMIFAGRGT